MQPALATMPRRRPSVLRAAWPGRPGPREPQICRSCDPRMLACAGLPRTTRPGRATAPITAAMMPTSAPPATMTSRSCLRVAPIAASIPSWRWRRAAMTAKAAAATRETSTIRTVTAPSAPAATAAWVLAPRACHSSGPWKVSLKAANAAGLASSRTVTPCAGPAADGGTSANWSVRSLGFSRCQSPSGDVRAGLAGSQGGVEDSALPRW